MEIGLLGHLLRILKAFIDPTDFGQTIGPVPGQPYMYTEVIFLWTLQVENLIICTIIYSQLLTASNFGKMFERIINNRISKTINITEAQAGGQKGRATVDHLTRLKDTIQTIRNNKKPAYIVFLDVTKAYDKAWLDAILYIMHKEGTELPMWKIAKELNSNLRARINTKYGQTREINITDSIRQGGVLPGISVTAPWALNWFSDENWSKVLF